MSNSTVVSQIQRDLYARLSHVIDPEIGKSIVDLGMVCDLQVIPDTTQRGDTCKADETTGEPCKTDEATGEPCNPSEISKTGQSESTGQSNNTGGTITTGDASSTSNHADTGQSDNTGKTAEFNRNSNTAESYNSTHKPQYDVLISVELTVAGCPLSQTIVDRIIQAVITYPDAQLTPHISVNSMSKAKLSDLVAQLKSERNRNPFSRPSCRTKIVAVASGKGGVGKSTITASLAAVSGALGYDTALIDADVYGFSLPGIFGVTTQPTNLEGMLMPIFTWGIKLISIGVFAGSDKAILWRGPRLQRSLEQFLCDVWWGSPDILFLDLPPGTGDMTIALAQCLPSCELLVVTTPQTSASDIAVRSGLAALQLPMHVAGVVENMSYLEQAGSRLALFGEGGGRRVAEQLSTNLGYDVPLLGHIALNPDWRVSAEEGRPPVLEQDGKLASHDFAILCQSIVEHIMKH